MPQDTLSEGQKLTLDDTIAEYHRRLYDIIWLMRNLNEYIAREANKEDGCTGKFYFLPSIALILRASEGWFKSQALLDDAALLSCMAFVDRLYYKG
jgi:hypothetical protein